MAVIMTMAVPWEEPARKAEPAARRGGPVTVVAAFLAENWPKAFLALAVALLGVVVAWILWPSGSSLPPQFTSPQGVIQPLVRQPQTAPDAKAGVKAGAPATKGGAPPPGEVPGGKGVSKGE